MPYQKINWQNGEAGGTPLNATNLNNMDAQIDANTTAIATNTADIAEIKSNTEFNLTSASPLNGCSASSIVGIDVDGCSTQGTSANMLNPSLNTSTVNGITCTKNSDCTYTLNGTSSGSAMFTLNSALLSLEAITYTFALADNSNVKARVVQDTNGTRIELKNEAKQTTFTASSDSSYIFQINIASAVTLSNVVVKPTVTTTTPSPTNPIPIVDASGDVTCRTEDSTQSNTITLPTLRSVGDVKDELIVNADGSGQIIQNIYEETLTLNGKGSQTTSGYRLFYANLSKYPKMDSGSYGSSGYISSPCASNKLSGFVNSYNTMTAFCAKTYRASETSKMVLVSLSSDITELLDAQTLLGSFTLRYVLDTPIVTTLTASEVSAIRQLQTYSGTTIIDSELDVKSVSYNADAKAYIDERTNYKTEETLIGYWTDGKPLYRQVLKGATTNASSGGMVKGFYCADKSIKKFDGVINVTSSNQVVPINFYYPNSLYAYTYMTNGGIWCRTSNDLYYQPIEIVIEYTYKDTEDSVSVLSDDDEYYGLIDTPDDENIIGVITEG